MCVAPFCFFLFFFGKTPVSLKGLGPGAGAEAGQAVVGKEWRRMS